MESQVPWIERRLQSEHRARYARLMSLHECTLAWTTEMKIERPGHFLDRKPKAQRSADFDRTLAFLEAYLPGSGDLDLLLDDTDPSDLLVRLERSVFLVHGSVVEGILGGYTGEAKDNARGVLEQISWNEGKRYFESTWGSSVAGNDLRVAFAAWEILPLFPHSLLSPLLARRKTEDELDAELLACPHCQVFPELKEVADDLCLLHSHWLRGFAYGWNLSSQLEWTKGKRGQRCRVLWRR